MSKQALRNKIAQIPFSKDRDNNIIDNIIDIITYLKPKIIGLYIPQPNEIDLITLLIKLPHQQFAAPKIIAFETTETLIFAPFTLSTELNPNKFYHKYLEPVSENHIVPDLILIPGYAFDIKGHRLGKGKGHYDKYLANHPNIIKIGLCRQNQLLEHIPFENHDISMNYIITDTNIIKF